jgi:hypothetical protein
MIAVEAIQELQIKIGARPGQIVLSADLTLLPKPEEALERFREMGYQPKLHFCAFATGLHVLAVLKSEQFDPACSIDDEYLVDEWFALTESFGQDAVRLWRGHPEAQEKP